MSSETKTYLKFGGATVVILLLLGYLAYTGVQDSKSYYVTIKELHEMGDGAYTKRLRVAGNVQPGSIKRTGTQVQFVLVEEDQNLAVDYTGTEAPPDTFKDNSQALADGQLRTRRRVSCQATAGEVRFEICAATAGHSGERTPGRARQEHDAGADRPSDRRTASAGSDAPNSATSKSVHFRTRRLRISTSLANRDKFYLRRDVRTARFCRRYPVNDSATALARSSSPFSNLVKQFGRFAALRGVTAEFDAGRFHAILGDNGAGKTTLLRALAGLAQPTRGEISIFGKTPQEACRDIGYMAHPSLLYDEMSGMENLRYFARLYGIPATRAAKK